MMRGIFEGVGEYGRFAGRGLAGLLRGPFEGREILRQLFELGVRTLPLIFLSGMAVGAVMSMHTRASLERFGAESLIPAGLAIATIKETGPLVTGLLVSGRVGAGIGAALGGMKVTEQVDALESLAVDSFQFLVVTRIAACMLAQPLLTIFFDASALLGGYLAETVISGMTLDFYIRQAFSVVTFTDLLPSTLKTVVFGFLIASISSFLGYTASGGAEGVGRASTRSVVFSSIVLITVNVVLVKAITVLWPVS